LLTPGYIELVQIGDPLAGASNEHVGKIKFYAWKGPDYISDPNIDEAGVDWILAENWWPYQRPTFITPPFAGYVSGHSTFSRAAAEVLTLFTGSEYFPGGMGEFLAKKNQFLVFEEGPSEDVKLQWATYRDASDQCSLSRIWGGIHPPADDVPGRLMGITIGVDAFHLAETYFTRDFTGIHEGEQDQNQSVLYPNPVSGDAVRLKFTAPVGEINAGWMDVNGRLVADQSLMINEPNQEASLSTASLPSGIYVLRLRSKRTAWQEIHRVVKQ
jgi:hypothetical protein